VFDVEEDVTYVKRLYLNLPDRVDEDKYKLRLLLTDRDGDELIENYNLKIDVPRHHVKVRDVVFSPENQVTAGRALLTSVLVKNYGEKDEDSLKVMVSVPELGVSASDYIDELEADESILSEEIFMRIPESAAAGEYAVKVSVEYDEGYEVVTTQRTISVLAAEDREEPSDDDDDGKKTVVTLSTEMQELVAGQGGAVYPVSLTNKGTSSKTFFVAVEGADEWATHRITPSNVVVVEGGETETLYVYVAAKEDASSGDKMFTLTISSADEVLKEIPLKASVEGRDSPVVSWERVKKALEIGFVVLVVVLVVLAIVVGLTLMRRKEEPDELSGQTYY
jgi:uncharacterized membrane protein